MYNSPKHRGALDCLPFQGFARRSGIQVFRLYSRHHQLRITICGESATHFVRGLEGAAQLFIMITSRSWCRVSPSHPHNAGREGLPPNHRGIWSPPVFSPMACLGPKLLDMSRLNGRAGNRIRRTSDANSAWRCPAPRRGSSTQASHTG